MKKIIFCALLLPVALTAAAQYVRNADVMYQKTIIRAMDLRERQNRWLFAKNREITGLLIEAVLKGRLTPYVSDSLNAPLTLEQFQKRLLIPSSEPVITDPAEIEIVTSESGEDAAPAPEYYFARDLYEMELRERVLFDKERSQLTYDIQTLAIFIPADHPQNIKGIQEPVATFRFEEICEKVFANNPNALAYNEQNEAQHKNLADAFKLRLFSSYIVKVSNADDQYLADKYLNPEKGIMASQWASQELLEYEHHLWEF